MEDKERVCENLTMLIIFLFKENESHAFISYLDVGIIVGKVDGALLGDADGDVLGPREGESVGSDDGEAENDTVGAPEGSKLMLGAKLGRDEGY
jgi:hypothetical protein